MKTDTELVWENHLATLSNLFDVLYKDSALVDVTLSCQGGFLRAHKLVLSACSPYFHQVFQENPCKHPTIVLRSVCYQDMAKLLEYMYRGSISVPTEHLDGIVHVANDLKIKGFEAYKKKPDDAEETATEANEITVPEIKPLRDTRFKGQKRVNVDYVEEPAEEPPPVKEVCAQNNAPVCVTSEPVEEGPKTNAETTLQPEPEVMSTSENEDDEENEDKCNKEPPDVTNKIITLFECDVCSRRFKSRKDLQKHKKIHQDKSFSCEFCNKMFSRASHLIRHRRVHTGERPFVCDTCGKDFARQDKLKLHIRTSHNNNIDKETHAGEVQVGTVENKGFADNDNDSESEPSEHITLENLALNSSAGVVRISKKEKRGRGRPRKYPLGPPKRHRARSKDDDIYEDNYDITSLPYGDLSYLTMPYEQGIAIEPLVEIRTDANLEPEVKPSENGTAPPDDPPQEDPVLMTIGKIGECTISLN